MLVLSNHSQSLRIHMPSEMPRPDSELLRPVPSSDEVGLRPMVSSLASFWRRFAYVADFMSQRRRSRVVRTVQLANIESSLTVPATVQEPSAPIAVASVRLVLLANRKLKSVTLPVFQPAMRSRVVKRLL